MPRNLKPISWVLPKHWFTVHSVKVKKRVPFNKKFRIDYVLTVNQGLGNPQGIYKEPEILPYMVFSTIKIGDLFFYI